MDDECDEDAEKAPPEFDIHEDNLLIVNVFRYQETKWRVLFGEFGVLYQGLSNTEIQATLELMRVKRKKWPEIFEGLWFMERAAIKVLNQRK